MIGKYEIINVRARQILDSRGNPTIECEVTSGKGFGRAQVPAGASTGKYEARELRDKVKGFGGKGVSKAVLKVNEIIAPKLINHDVRDQDGIDRMMISLDNTPSKKVLGANAMLAVSIACAKTAASAKEAPLHEHLNAVYNPGNPTFMIPVPFFNVLNGGLHAGNHVSIQEFMIVPHTDTYSHALQIAAETYYTLKEVITKKYGSQATGIGDEGGFAPPLKKTEDALKLLETAVQKAGHTKHIKFALDCAATSFYKGRKYIVDKKTMNRDKLMKFYEKLADDYDIVSIEDPFHEEDFKGFAQLTDSIGAEVQIVGDDLFASNTERIKEGIRIRAANAIILKPNQVGTLSETFAAAQLAAHSNYGVMASHRSGDNADPFIANLAVGLATKQLKAGAPCRGERVEKYNELLRIEELGVPYASWF